MDFSAIWFILIMVCVVAVFVIAIVKSARDKKRWSLWARARGWEFLPRWPEMVKAFRGGPFGRGSSRTAALGFRGTFDGMPASGFRYQYSTGSGKNRSTHYYTVLRIQVRAARFPGLSLARETWGTRTFGSDVQFEDAEFNHQWRVMGPNARFVHDVIHPRMMEFLKSHEVPTLASLWLEQDSLLVSFRGNLREEQVDAYLRLLTDFFSRMPGFVLDEVAPRRPELTWDGPGISAQEQAQRMAQLRQKSE